MLTEKLPEVATKYCCECCHYYTDKTSSYNKHLLTAKHHRKHKLTDKSLLVATKIICCDNCNKVYKSRVGLWKHKRMCKIPVNTITSEPSNDGMSTISFILYQLFSRVTRTLTIIFNKTPRNNPFYWLFRNQ